MLHSSAQLSGNPHILRPSLRDYDPRPPASLTQTFSPRLPSLYVPSVDLPSSHPLSSSQGQFYLSLKGVRKTLLRLTGPAKGEGGRIEEILGIVERELVDWLERPQLNHRTYGARLVDATPIPILGGSGMGGPELSDLPSYRPELPSSSTLPAITEYIHTPSHLLWSIPDSHTRFLTHVLARYYSLPSYSTSACELPPSHSAHTFDKSVRVTHFLRPNLVRPDFRAVGGIDTPDVSASDRDVRRGVRSSEGESGSESGAGGIEGMRRRGEESEEEWEEVVRDWVDVRDLELEMEFEGGEGEGEEMYTDDEASSVATTEDGGGGGSMDSSISDLRALDLGIENTPRPVPGSGILGFASMSPTPTRLRNSLGGETPTPLGARRSTTTRGRRSDVTPGGGYGGESSPSVSRSPTREREAGGRDAGREERVEWMWPERTFAEFLFGREE